MTRPEWMPEGYRAFGELDERDKLIAEKRCNPMTPKMMFTVFAVNLALSRGQSFVEWADLDPDVQNAWKAVAAYPYPPKL